MKIDPATVWQQFHPDLARFVARRIPEPAAAEDVLQDVYLKLHTQLNSLRDSARLPAWLYQVTRNAITDYYRQRPTLELPDDLPLPPAEDPPDETALRLAQSVRSMADQLPAHYREALLLVDYEGLSQLDLAERLNLSYSGAKSRVQRARELLKQMLLACCHVQFDRVGNILDYQPRCLCCHDAA